MYSGAMEILNFPKYFNKRQHSLTIGLYYIVIASKVKIIVAPLYAGTYKTKRSTQLLRSSGGQQNFFFGYYGYHSLTWSRLVSSRCLKCWMVWCLSLCRALSNFCKHFCTRWVLGVFSLRAFKKREKNKLWIFLSIVQLREY